MLNKILKKKCIITDYNSLAMKSIRNSDAFHIAQCSTELYTKAATLFQKLANIGRIMHRRLLNTNNCHIFYNTFINRCRII